MEFDGRTWVPRDQNTRYQDESIPEMPTIAISRYILVTGDGKDYHIELGEEQRSLAYLKENGFELVNEEGETPSYNSIEVSIDPLDTAHDPSKEQVKKVIALVVKPIKESSDDQL